jgi:DNA-binding MarR family transcriptional regulator
MTKSVLSKLIFDSVPFAMGAIRGEMRKLARSQLTVPQFRILVFLFKEGIATASALAEWQGVSLPAMSKMVSLLASKGFIARTADSSDRRSAQLKLTKKGQRFFLSVRFRVEEKIDVPLSKLSPTDQNSLREGLRVLKELFQ